MLRAGIPPLGKPFNHFRTILEPFQNHLKSISAPRRGLRDRGEGSARPLPWLGVAGGLVNIPGISPAGPT